MWFKYSFAKSDRRLPGRIGHARHILAFLMFVAALTPAIGLGGTGGLDVTAGYGYLDLRWDAAPVSDVDSFEIRWGTTPGFPDNSVEIRPQTRYQITGLTNGKTYHVQLWAKRGDDEWQVGPERKGAPTGGCIPGDVTRNGIVDAQDAIMFQKKSGRSIWPEMSKITIDWDKMTDCVDVDGDELMGEPETEYALQTSSDLLLEIPFKNVRVSLLTYLPATVSVGEEVYFLGVVSNQGDIPTSGFVGVSWMIDGIILKEELIDSLEAQESATTFLYWTAEWGYHNVNLIIYPPDANSMDVSDYGYLSIEVPREPKNLVRDEIPGWFSETVAIYAPSSETSGGSLLTIPVQVLCEKINSFYELPALLDEAQRMGTSVLYLTDFWEGIGRCEDPYSCWVNKGEYKARTDFGGEKAFREGIEAVHEQDGRVILYVEPFIIHVDSEAGHAHGAEWSMIDEDGRYYDPYVNNWTLCPDSLEWLDYLSRVCFDLTDSLVIDGLYFDSYGFQWDWVCHSPLHDHPPGGNNFNYAAYKLLREVSAVSKSANPDLAIMTEGPERDMFRYVDGSQDWDIAKVLSTPGLESLNRYRLFLGGYNIDSINLAAGFGYNLALGPLQLMDADYIRYLLSARRELKDALVHGLHRGILSCDSTYIIPNLF
ncbi:MAG: fibronectin type III domain-containing protein, partial [Candidatus Coatesbacteria bacterium]|nr:fibronectin type III domain-containing protein [Candidatus Coatesbacteria bacterium]